MTNQAFPSPSARPWRSFSLTLFACLGSAALLTVACGSTTDDSGSGGTVGAGGEATGGTVNAGGSAAGGTVGTGGSVGAGGSAAGGGGACDIPAIMNLRCGSSICHGVPGDTTTVPLGNVDLLNPGVEARIYNIPATYANITTGSTNCPTPAELLLDPAGTATSLMYTKINGGHACGAAMPNVGSMKPEEITCYNAWLEDVVANPPQ